MEEVKRLRELRFTRRKQADLRTALEVTAAFRELVPGDPVRYDFTLTHLGISGEVSRVRGQLWGATSPTMSFRPFGCAQAKLEPESRHICLNAGSLLPQG